MSEKPTQGSAPVAAAQVPLGFTALWTVRPANPKDAK
jgi:hypothetical protein